MHTIINKGCAAAGNGCRPPLLLIIRPPHGRGNLSPYTMTSSAHSPFNLRLRTWVTVATIFSGALIFTSCNSNAKDELAHHDHEHEGEEAEGHSGKEIVIEPEQAKMLGIETTAIKPSPFSDVLKVSGRIMETASATGTASAPTSGIVTFANGITEGCRVKAGQRIATVRAGRTTGGDPNAAARANMEAAKRELDRLKPLHEHGIVSTAEYNAALAAYNSAKALYSPGASTGAVVAPVSGTLTALSVRNGGFVEAGAPVASISSGTVHVCPVPGWLKRSIRYSVCGERSAGSVLSAYLASFSSSARMRLFISSVDLLVKVTARI